jgi:arginase family enzyme
MTNLTNTSIASGYAGFPFGEVSQCEAGNIAVLGVPSDENNEMRSGTSLAPDALRSMTQQLGSDLPENGWDLGNLETSGDWPDTLIKFLTQMVNQGIIPVVLGGGSDVASAVLRSLPDSTLVTAMPVARADVAERPKNTIWVGLNGEQPADVWNQISQRGMVWRTARQLDEEPTYSFDIPQYAVLWIDISVIDLGHAAGAIGLNPAGLKPETLVSVIGAMSCSWQAIVITGLAPARDTRGLSELVVIETLNAALSNE